MFKREVKSLGDIVLRNLRYQGLETPLLQKRLVDSWPEVAGLAIANCTSDVSIYNQTLYVRITTPALRADLNMRRHEFIVKLNSRVGAQVITDIRFC